MKKIIIDNEILFLPEKKELISLHTNKTVSMYSTGARCLEYLIEKQGNTIPAKDLISAIWTEKDSLKTVTQAAYYQCLVDLRKKFKELKFDKKLIHTIRGHGVKFNTEIQVIIENIDNTSGDKANLSKLAYSTRPRKIKNKIFFCVASLVVIVTIIISCIFLINQSRQDRYSWAENYHLVEGFPECYFFNKKNVNNELAFSLMKSNKYSCDSDHLYFISHYDAAPRLTFFYCANILPLHCESVTILGGNP